MWEQTDTCLRVYEEDPSRVLQDANNERRISEGGYARRQLEELVQNAVDAARKGGGRVEVLLTEDALYVANDGEPFDEDGVRAVMASDISSKSDDKIGKFGIGFKSLLAVSEAPKIFSRTVSFGFDKQWAADTLREEGYEYDNYPVMRLAKTLDPQGEASRDPHLREMTDWASTVVVVPLSTGVKGLSKRLYDFPGEFILFSPHIKAVRLRNLAEPDPTATGGGTGRPQERVITQQIEHDGSTKLVSGRTVTRWIVTRKAHVPSARALADAGHVAARDHVQVQYALRLPPSVSTGRFWAYFPTHFETTLSGLINAPWKLSDDRTGLLDGAFNHELLDVLPSLFSEAIHTLSSSDSAVRALDAMPARGRESRNWVDAHINERIFAHLRTVPSLPDGKGTLRVPRELRWVADVEDEWLRVWAQVPGAPVGDWVHPEACNSPERRLKVDRLLGASGSLIGAMSTATPLDEWLTSLIVDQSVSASAAAIDLAAKILDDAENLDDRARARRIHDQLKRARIIRLESGDFAAPVKGRVFVRIEGDEHADALFVDPTLAAVPGVKDNLRRLGVVVMDRSGELHALLARAKQSQPPAHPDTIWPQVWNILRELPIETGLRILHEDLGDRLDLSVRMRTAAGKWVLPGEAFLAGSIVPANGARDRESLIDPVFHRPDHDLLSRVGAVDSPVWRPSSPREDWFSLYESAAKDQFVQAQNGKKPDHTKIVLEGSRPAWPLQPLIEMSDEGRAAATAHLLARGLPQYWTARHATSKAYSPTRPPAPEFWFIRKFGLIETSFGLLRPHRVIQARPGIDPKSLPAFEATDAVAAALNLKSTPDDLDEHEWLELKKVVDGWIRTEEDDSRRTEFYSWLTDRVTPETLVVRVGWQRQAVPLKNIGVTDDPSVYETMLEAQVPALYAETQENFERFTDVAHWGLPLGTDLLQEEIVTEPAGEAQYLTDLFPPLKLHLSAEDQDLKLQPCARLVKMVATPQGQRAHPIRARREGDTVFVTAPERQERVRQVSDVLGLELTSNDISRVFQQMEESAVNELRQRIKRATNDDQRLIIAAGLENLRRIVPAQALRALEERPGGIQPEDVSRLARAVHGVSVLKQLRSVLEERGLQPPKEWAGRRLTRNWVTALGFPADWAGFPTNARPAVEMIDGPAVLTELHPYQIDVTERITALLRGIGKDRGMVSLPTGAGKTRVTVQALVEGVRNRDIPTEQPLVWIAQTDELCEQAAETWTYVWRAVGPQIPMRLGRLWASNEVDEEPGTFQLIIATIDKLQSIKDKAGSEYGWLQSPSVVVIDEAHTSIAPSYTQVLEWLGRRSAGRSTTERKPLIGLTATPFRGTSKFETARLVNRYDGNRLDRGSFRNADDPYGELQEMGVLARVRQELLDGAEVELTASDISEIEKMRRLPSAVTDRLGEDLDRTERIIDSMAQLPKDWSILAFAPSVENARVLAALLSHRGISAVSVSSDTEPAARRHYVEEFKAGNIRVLTNYGVFMQGFDAPQVQAVYVTRPTFSPNVYQQMIGRGLRGPKNGGSEEVLIVNVKDNFQKYGDLLAFTEFEYLWSRR